MYYRANVVSGKWCQAIKVLGIRVSGKHNIRPSYSIDHNIYLSNKPNPNNNNNTYLSGV